ncbi:MAG: type II toxin-antitoxin system HicB family antitoxin [Beijerinckiaceae bacterium]
MTHHVAIVEEEEGKAIGVWFPDLPGCVSAGDTLDEAIQNAAEALELWAEAMIESGQEIRPPRSLTDLKADTDVALELANFMVALIPFPEGLRRREPYPVACDGRSTERPLARVLDNIDPLAKLAAKR